MTLQAKISDEKLAELDARMLAAKRRMEHALARLTPEERGEVGNTKKGGLFQRFIKSFKIF